MPHPYVNVMKTIAYIVALATVVVSCNNTNTSSDQSTANEETSGTTVPLYDTHWKLVELDGKPIVLDSTSNKDPYLVFTEADQKVEGHAGCNGFGGLLAHQGPDDINISQIAATQMACPNLAIEQHFFEALQNADSYRISGDTLTVNSAQAGTLAKFVSGEPDLL